jgi:hypothetical protein
MARNVGRIRLGGRCRGAIDGGQFTGRRRRRTMYSHVFKSRNCIQIKINMSMLLLDQHFVFFPMVDLFLL